MPSGGHLRDASLRFLALLFVVAPNTSCRLHRNHVRSTITIERQQTLRSRSLTEFSEAVFVKPRLDGVDEAEADLAPLIVEQAAESQTRETRYLFGAVVTRRDGTLEVDAEDRVVYTGTSLVRIGQPEYRQVIFVWAYPPAKATEAIHWRGVRATIGTDGFPLAWEVLSSDTDERHLFVASSLERAAVEAFGEPVQDRRFAIERHVGETPLTVVLRIIEDGPIPMGPYVYLADPAHDVTTLLCRCSPAQIGRFVAEGYYDLVPLESLDKRAIEWIPDPIDLSLHLRWVDTAPRQ
ncbi:MAG: hypothetical protein IH897_09380 [Planctomycetes bacterium]|nr:hypothetical protein [Planctomycetota bacterium]